MGQGRRRGTGPHPRELIALAGPAQALRQLRSRAIGRREDVLLITAADAPFPDAGGDRLEIVAIEPAHRAELEAHVRRHHGEWQQSVAMIEDCYRRGFGGHLGRLDGEIVGYRWWSGPDHVHPHYDLYGFRPQADEVYSFSLHVAKPFRSQGFASEIVARARRALLAQGCRAIRSVVSSENAASLRLQVALGAREVRRCTVVRLLDRYEACGGRLRRLDPVWS